MISLAVIASACGCQKSDLPETTQLNVEAIHTAAYVTIIAGFTQTEAARSVETPVPPAMFSPAGAEKPAEVTTQPVQGCIVVAQQVNIRSGPGINYPVVGTKLLGECAAISGINPERTWAKVNEGWIIMDYLAFNVESSLLSIVGGSQPTQLAADNSPIVQSGTDSTSPECASPECTPQPNQTY